MDGHGYWWWMREYLILNKGTRPHLLAIQRVRNIRIEGVKWQNSPSYHIKLDDVDQVVMQNFEIWVNAFEQHRLHQQFGGFYNFGNGTGYPTYALNTDGIDPSGSNMLIRNLTITSYDDAVAVKPMH